MLFRSEFNIDLVYTGDSAYQWAFDRAIERWEQVITADLPDTRVTGSVTLDSINFGYLSNQLIDDVRIYGAVQYIDGPGGTLGAAGPRYVRGWDSARDLPDAGPNGLPVVGVMVFDSADMESMLSDGLLETTVVHEMGHVLGALDLYWEANGFQGDYFAGLNDPSSDYYQYASTNIHDPNAPGTVSSQAYSQIGRAHV